MDLDVVDPLERIPVAIVTSRADYGDLAAGSSESETLLPDTLVGGNGQVLDEHQYPRWTAFFFGDFLQSHRSDARRSSRGEHYSRGRVAPAACVRGRRGVGGWGGWGAGGGGRRCPPVVGASRPGLGKRHVALVDEVAPIGRRLLALVIYRAIGSMPVKELRHRHEAVPAVRELSEDVPRGVERPLTPLTPSCMSTMSPGSTRPTTSLTIRAVENGIVSPESTDHRTLVSPTLRQIRA